MAAAALMMGPPVPGRDLQPKPTSKRKRKLSTHDLQAKASRKANRHRTPKTARARKRNSKR